MTSGQLQRAVAVATGETLREVRHRGFGPADPAQVAFDPEPDDVPPETVDWDALTLERCDLFPARA